MSQDLHAPVLVAPRQIGISGLHQDEPFASRGIVPRMPVNYQTLPGTVARADGGGAIRVQIHQIAKI
jgi:hypothetical protein